MADARVTLTDMAIILGSLAALVTIIGGLVSFVRWYRRRRGSFRAEKREVFSKVYKDLSLLWERLNEIREKGPRDITLGCFKLGFEKWDESSNWEGLSEERRDLFSKKLRSRLDAVNKAYSDFRRALKNLNEVCNARLLDLISEHTNVDSDYPPIMFGELVGAWVDSVIRNGYQADDIFGWPVAEALITAKDTSAAIRRQSSPLNISKMTLAKCCTRMILDVDKQESEIREEFDKAESELRKVVKEARQSFPSEYSDAYKPTPSPFE